MDVPKKAKAGKILRWIQAIGRIATAIARIVGTISAGLNGNPKNRNKRSK